jgi:hypothetical protein
MPLKAHKSDPSFAIFDTDDQWRSSSIEQSSPSSATAGFYQIFINTKLMFQGIGYNIQRYMFDDNRPVGSSGSSMWILGSYESDSDRFYSRWKSLCRITYTRNWPNAFVNTRTGISYDSDTGWGCTIRSFQMLLANIFGHADLFSDSFKSPLGIHAFLSKSPSSCGEWFGPTSACLIVRELIEERFSNQLGIVISTDGMFNISDIEAAAGEFSISSRESSVGSLEQSPRAAGGFVDVGNVAAEEEVWVIETSGDVIESARTVQEKKIFVSTPQDGGWEKPVLIIIPIRLSPLTNLSEAALGPVMSYITLPTFAGLIGGPDRRCHFIVGMVSETVITDDGSPPDNVCSLLAIDPHIVQSCQSWSNSEHPHRISPRDLCPSIAIAFVLKNRNDLDDLRQQAKLIADMNQMHAFLDFRDSSRNPTSELLIVV